MSDPTAIDRLLAGLRRAIVGGPSLSVDQAAALIWRERSGIAEILLVTSRGTGRWVLPKGWIEMGEDHAQAAAREAWEEAGAWGDVADTGALGHYDYDKLDADGSATPTRVAVHAIALTHLADEWPERGERRRRWMSCAEAARQVDEPDLKSIIAAFDAGGKRRAA